MGEGHREFWWGDGRVAWRVLVGRWERGIESFGGEKGEGHREFCWEDVKEVKLLEELGLDGKLIL
jgi:hypothetical protein